MQHVAKPTHLLFQTLQLVATLKHHMKDPSKTKQKLIEELSVLKQRLQKLERSESDRKQADEELLEREENFRRSLDIHLIFNVQYLIDIYKQLYYISTPTSNSLLNYIDKEYILKENKT